MIINPLRTRQHTSQHKNSVVQTEENSKFTKLNASVSTFFENPPSAQFSHYPNQNNNVSIGNHGLIFVSPLLGSKDSPMPGPTGLYIRKDRNSSDLEHIAQVVISSQSKMKDGYASNYPLGQKKPQKLQKQQRFAPILNFRSTKEESEELPIDQMNLTGETLLNPNLDHNMYPNSQSAQMNGIMAAKLKKGTRDNGQSSSTKMLIISSAEQLEQLEKLGVTAALPELSTFEQPRQVLSSPSTPKSSEQV